MAHRTKETELGPHRRLIALEIRARKFGFVVLEDTTKLLDWGVRSYAGHAQSFPVVAGKRLRALLELYQPA